MNCKGEKRNIGYNNVRVVHDFKKNQIYENPFLE